MNRLPIEKRVQILGLLTEGNSLRATSRLADVSINTVTKLLVDVGVASEIYQLTTDGHRAYLTAVEAAFGGEIDYAMLEKLYTGQDAGIPPERRYSPGHCV